MADEPTVEQALAELREMFPTPAGVSVHYREEDGKLTVFAWEGVRCIGAGSTLSEAMQQVRQWHKEQSQ